MTQEPFPSKYLGDGVYCTSDGFHIILTTQREHGEDKIFLDPSCLVSLLEYLKLPRFNWLKSYELTHGGSGE